MSSPPAYSPKEHEEQPFIQKGNIYQVDNSGYSNYPSSSYPSSSYPSSSYPNQPQPYSGYSNYPQQGQAQGQGPTYYGLGNPSDFSKNQQQTPSYYESGVQPDVTLYVYEQPREIKMAFIRKVYTILLCQILLTIGFGALCIYVSDIKNWVQKNYWLIWVNLIPTILVLILLIWKRRQAPINFILLTIFTLLESYTIGVIVSFYDEEVVIEALIITLAIFLGLTLFTFQTKYDFSGFGPALLAALVGLLVLGILQIFFRNQILEIVYCSIGVIVFCAFILYDTQNIIKRSTPEEYIMGSVSLYLDVLNLFLFILRLLGIARNN